MRVETRRLLPALALVAVGLAACTRRSEPPPAASEAAPPAAMSGAPSAAAPVDAAPAVRASGAASPDAPPAPPAEPAAAAPPDPSRYAWLTSPGLKAPAVADTLSARFPTPPGRARVQVAPGSFAAWLRDLPLASPGTPVTSHKGETVRPADDDYLAAVVAMDVGRADLQQSSDVVLRLHAEWLWSAGERDAISYRAANGTELPLARWAKGERIIAVGAAVTWQKRAKGGADSHTGFREFLDSVFAFANSTSLAQQATPVAPEDLRPGDFFLHPRSPFHATLVLDVVVRDDGERLALLGQALNPAQSVHVLRPGRGTAWFTLRPERPLLTPYTEEFPWSGLMRLERKVVTDGG
ncbi:MAG: hypothetical protein IT376_21145 [Polyangiaceae bacterium]|nr:hypothetical protein [Polyangiaceae bacterium]